MMPLYDVFPLDTPLAATLLRIDSGTLAVVLWAALGLVAASLVAGAVRRRHAFRPTIVAAPARDTWRAA